MRSRLLSLLLLLVGCMVAQAQTRTIVDMKGRSVQVPTRIRRVYAPTPNAYDILLAVAPDLLPGLLSPLGEEDKPFLNPALRTLPFIGGYYGGSRTMKVLLQKRPDLLLMWEDTGHSLPKAPDELQKLGIPEAYGTMDNMSGYPGVYRFVGKLLGREARCERLAEYTQKTLDQAQAAMKRVPPASRPRVYYAEGLDGLSTECQDSIHTEILKLAGDCNVHRCHAANFFGMEKITLEQVLMYNPDVLLVQEKTFYDRVWSDPAWQRVKAVKEGRIYLIPRTPLNWFDRPPSFMRILGLQWLMHTLYPKEYPVNIVKEAQTFYSLFLGVQVSDEQMRKVIYRK